jgi:NADH-quinone oxidoreductase subunit J
LLALAQQTPAPAVESIAPVLFYGFAAVTVLAAWAILVSRNIVRMAVYLLLTLGGVAGLYFMLGAELLAAIQLIVYAGGTLVLIVFGVMLTTRNLFMQLKTAGWERVLGTLLGLVIAGLLLVAVVVSPLQTEPPAAAARGYNQVQQVGFELVTDYLVPFEVAAVVLLVVMIAAGYMARRRAGE